MPDLERQTWEYKDVLVAVPIVTAAAAGTYDIGYFYGLDITFFSFFTLAEHTSFALEAMPLVLVLLGFVISSTLGFQWGYRSAAAADAQGLPRPHERKPKIVSYLLILIPLGLIILGYLERLFLLPTMGAWMLLLFFISEFFSADFLRTVLFRSPINAMLALAFLLSLTLTAGIDRARNFLRDSSIIHTISTDAGDLKGRIARSGERGVLLYDTAAQHLVLVRWQNIQRVLVPSKVEPRS